jgi:predicted RNA binding protein YcfA (HicA-like mRNA interferase family)
VGVRIALLAAERSLSRLKYREILKLVEDDGWRPKRSRGSHRHYKHPTKPGTVTIALHGRNKEVPPGTLNSILKLAGLRK